MIPQNTLRDRYGRAFDDLDSMRLHIAARDLAAQAGYTGYSVVSEDGAPMVGLHDGTPAADFVARGWRAKP